MRVPKEGDFLVSTSTSIFYSYINVSNIAVLLIMLVGAVRIVAKDKKSKVFFQLSIIFAMIENLFDCFWNLSSDAFISTLYIPVAIRHIVNALYFFSLCASAYFWLVFSELSYKKTFFKNKPLKICTLIPMFCLVLLLLLNPFTGWLYTFNSEGVQVKSTLFYLQQVFAYSYVVILAIKHFSLTGTVIKSKNRIELFILLSFCIPSVLCAVLQICFPYLPILSSAPVFSILSLYASLLLRQAETDGLTGISNGNVLYADLEKSVKSVKPGYNVFILFMDIDSFKGLNDTRGHAEGNKVLKLLADVLCRACLDYGASCYRYGGDEFVVVSVLRSGEDTKALSKRIKSDFMHESFVNFGYPVYLSVGHACLEKGIDDVSSLLAKADENMYQKKKRKYMSKKFGDEKSQGVDLVRFYFSVGGNATEVVNQLGGDEAMVKKFLKMFLSDGSFSGLTQALEEEDTKTAFRMAHTLKGVAANLGLKNLYADASRVTEFLRADNLSEALTAMPDLRQEYSNVCALIKELV